MMPFMKLNTRPVTTSQPPQSSAAARARSVRGARPRSTSRATRKTSAAGSSHEIWPPISLLNKRVQPVSPQLDGPTLPVSEPVRRPKPL
jgi:hypothetical protein